MEYGRVFIISSIIKNSSRYGEQLLSKLNNIEGIIGRHLSSLNKRDGRNDKVYGKINSKPSTVAAKDTKFFIINKQ